MDHGSGSDIHNILHHTHRNTQRLLHRIWGCRSKWRGGGDFLILNISLTHTSLLAANKLTTHRSNHKARGRSQAVDAALMSLASMTHSWLLSPVKAQGVELEGFNTVIDSYRGESFIHLPGKSHAFGLSLQISRISSRRNESLGCFCEKRHYNILKWLLHNLIQSKQMMIHFPGDDFLFGFHFLLAMFGYSFSSEMDWLSHSNPLNFQQQSLAKDQQPIH